MKSEALLDSGLSVELWPLQSTWVGISAWLTVVASIGLLGAASYWPIGPPHRDAPELGQQTPLPTWPSEGASDTVPKVTQRAVRTPLATEMPDFDRAFGTLGAGSGNRVTPWRLATLIVRDESGWGSGALISADGWFLTNYHVVALQAQEAALTGRPAVLDVIIPQMINGTLKDRAPVKATLYRADPARDLALLKLNRLPVGVEAMPHFRLAAQVSDGEDCIVIGSQGMGPAWMPRGGEVAQKFRFPDDLSEVVTGFRASGNIIDRGRMTVIASTVSVSWGDSGGPLLNSRGELIGITYASPLNASRGSIGWHVALEHLRGFISNRPSKPEGVPFDAWTAGLPHSSVLTPELGDGDGDGRMETVAWKHAEQTENESTSKGVAFTTFVDFGQRKPRDEGVGELMPSGLWGLEQGRFRFDVFITQRTDDVAAVGYTNQAGVVDEIRIGRWVNDVATLLWTRKGKGPWQANQPSARLPLLARDRVGEADWPRFSAILANVWNVGSPGISSERRGPRERTRRGRERPNVQ